MREGVYLYLSVQTHAIILNKHCSPSTEVPGNSLPVVVGGSVAVVAAAAVATLVLVFRRKHSLCKGEIV